MKQKHFFKNAVVQSVVLNKTSTYQKCPTILSKKILKSLSCISQQSFT